MGRRLDSLLRVTGAMLDLPSQCLELARRLDVAAREADEAYQREGAFRCALVDAIGPARFAAHQIDDAAILGAVRGLAVLADAVAAHQHDAPRERVSSPDAPTVRRPGTEED